MILYFNAAWLNHPAVKQTIIDYRGQDTFSRLTNLDKINPSHTAWYARKGVNLLPFKNRLMDVPGFAMPNYNADHNRSWTEITDQRCLDLRASHWDRPWTVMWSGGIDSTVIVAAMLKNLAPADLGNITIACTSLSVWENSKFYFDYIKPNFKVVDSAELLFKDFDSLDAYVINGEPADQLFGIGDLTSLYQNIDLFHTNIINNKDCAIDFIASRTDRLFAEWYYHVLLDSAASAGVSVTTLHDLIWWSVFNHAWCSVMFRFMAVTCGDWKNIKNAKSYINKFVPWYISDHYQQWAMNPSNIGEKIGTSAVGYKLAAKKYIYLINNDQYYLDFKTKVGSSDIFPTNRGGTWCCIDHNWNVLNLQEHQDQIISMLPDHLV
jgi:hypothetical protein